MTAPDIIRRFVTMFFALSGFGFWGVLAWAVVSEGIMPWEMVVCAIGAAATAILWIAPDIIRAAGRR